jgi:hypothetical protein
LTILQIISNSLHLPLTDIWFKMLTREGQRFHVMLV